MFYDSIFRDVKMHVERVGDWQLPYKREFVIIIKLFNIIY